MKKAITTFIILFSIVGIDYGQDKGSMIGSQQFKLWSWDGNQPTSAWLRSTGGTTSPWGMSFWLEGGEKMSLLPDGTLNLYNRAIFNVQPSGGWGEYIQNARLNTNGFGLSFFTNSTARLTINGAGYVGIGTSTPGYNLDVDGTAYFNHSMYAMGSVGVGTAAPAYKLDVQGNVRVTDRITFAESLGGGLGEFIQNTRLTSGVHGLSFFSGAAERLTINTNGLVGIGISSPDYRLDVAGTARISENAYITGKVGIGTSNPSHKLTVSGTNTGLFRLIGAQSSYGARMNFGDGEFAFIEEPVDDILRIHGSQGVYFDSKVGIGTSSPAYDLDINGTTHLSGSIGIGIAPQTKLDVSGDGRFNGSYLIGSDITRFNTIPAAKKANFSLWVEKGVVAKDFAVGDPTTWADYVFASDYKLPALPEVEAFIKANHHLPGMPAEATIKKEGYTLHDMNTRFLQKIEELTLYTIQLQKEIDTLKKQVANYEQLKQEIEDMKSLLKKANP